MAILKPYSYVLMNDEYMPLEELYLVDDDNILISEKLMEGLEDDLEKFWEQIAKE